MKRVLIVDDEVHLRFILKEVLNIKKYDVFEAGDGEEALEIAMKVKPHVILLDVSMPKMNGYEVTQKLVEKKAECKIIMLSAWAQKSDIHKGLSTGAHYYITKPFDLIKLSELIDDIVGQEQM